MTIRQLKKWLVEELDSAKEDYQESSKIARNSYGAGYAFGFYSALERVQLKINDALET